MAKQATEPITSRGTSDVLFERYIISERNSEIYIIVNEAEECAIIIKDGLLMETVEGGKYFIFDKSELKKNITLAEVIFIMKKAKIPLDWGTRTQLAFTDPVYNLPVKIGFNGVLEVQVGNPRKFYTQVAGRDSAFDKSHLKARILEDIPHCIQQAAAKFMESKNMSYLQIEQAVSCISEDVFGALSQKLMQEYGIKLNKFLINGTIIDNADNKALLYKKLTIEKENEREKEETRQKNEPKKAPEFILPQEKIKCKHCGTSLPKQANFCFQCGKNIIEPDDAKDIASDNGENGDEELEQGKKAELL